MPTHDTLDDMTPRPAAPDSAPRRLRRTSNGRVAAGVAGGLGDYFGVDPVLFRVLFATSAFFGGAGILAYLLAWAAIPDDAAAHAPIDGWLAALRRRRFPLWAIALGAGLLLWLVAFSWWAPGPFFPVLAVVALGVFFFGRRNLRGPGYGRPGPDAGVDFVKRGGSAGTGGTAAAGTGAYPPPAPFGPGRGPAREPGTRGASSAAGNTSASDDADDDADRFGGPDWRGDAQAWFAEARAASRVRRRRALPVRIGVLAALVLAFGTLGIIDAVTGISLGIYFWVGLAVVAAGLLAGLVSRRFSISQVPLLIPFIVGTIAFAGTDASLHDGLGKRTWAPSGAAAAQYRLAFGDGVLDLRSAGSLPSRIDVDIAAGQARVIVPKSLNATVVTHLRFGHVTLDSDMDYAAGAGIDRFIDPPAGASGVPVTIDVEVMDGNVIVERTG